MAIYTKKGDRGETSLYDPASSQVTRISKDSSKVDAIGTIDELNSSLGIATSFCEDARHRSRIESIQADLLRIGSILAGGPLRFSESKVKSLEREIDKLEAKLPVLANFILPGGTPLSAHLHLARSIARRTERAVVALSKEEKVSPSILSYLNRLSDLLFMLARAANFDKGIKDIIWKPSKRRSKR